MSVAVMTSGHNPLVVKPVDRSQRTWNSPEQIARHRAMTKAERFTLCADLSRAALVRAAAKRVKR